MARLSKAKAASQTNGAKTKPKRKAKAKAKAKARSEKSDRAWPTFYVDDISPSGWGDDTRITTIKVKTEFLKPEPPNGPLDQDEAHCYYIIIAFGPDLPQKKDFESHVEYLDVKRAYLGECAKEARQVLRSADLYERTALGGRQKLKDLMKLVKRSRAKVIFLR